MLSSIGIASVFAQGDPERVTINYTNVTETGGEQRLGLIVTVLDSAGQAVLNPELDEVNIVLDNGSPVEILGVSTPDIPLYITLVLDASGSMAPSAQAMRDAATTAVNNMPPNTQVAVVRFNQQIELLQGFTPDRAAVNAAINQVDAVQNAGTCLRDATFFGIEQLVSAPDPSRRAVILFTDGNDEITAGRGDTCSQHSSGEVIDLARAQEQPIPIYAIGLRGNGGINETELRNFADSTGGIAAFGDTASLTQTFQAIVNGLRGQQLIEARLCSEGGSRTGTLLIDDLEPSVTRFELETDCFLPTATPLPTNTPTPQPLELFIESFIVDQQAQTITFEVRRAGDVPATQLRVQVADGDTSAIQEQQVVDVGDGRVDVIQFPLSPNLTGDIGIIVSALDENGNVIARAENEFGITRATATPTPRPGEVFIESFAVPPGEEVMSFELRRDGDADIRQYRILVNDGRTGILLVERLVEVADETTQFVEISTADIAGGEITIVINALNEAGNVVARQTGNFAITRPTPTPTITPVPISLSIDTVEFDVSSKVLTLALSTRSTERVTDFRLTITNADTNLLQGTYNPQLGNRIELPLPTLEPGEYTVRAVVEGSDGERVEAESAFEYILLVTPTPVVRAEIRTIDLDNVNNEFIVRIDPENESEIKAYRVRVVNSESGLLVNEFTTFSLPPYDAVRFNNNDLPLGSYEITVFALRADESVIGQSTVEIDWTPPPTATPTPEPGFVERTTATLRSNPALAIGMALVVLALLGFLFFILRGRGKKEDTWGSALPSAGETGVFQVPKKPASAAGRSGASVAPQSDDDDRTQVLSASALRAPGATVVITKASPETGMQGQRVTVTSPFSIGRSGSSLNFPGDKTISRSHALITYDGSQFTIQDQGSGNGTVVDGRRLGPNEKATLRDSSIIVLGPMNELRFEMMDDSTQVFRP